LSRARIPHGHRHTDPGQIPLVLRQSRTRRTNRSELPSPRRTKPHPPDELERAPTRGVTNTPGDMPNLAAVVLLIHSFCLTPIQAALNVRGWLSRHLSRLDNHPRTLKQ
jgi:hypothetical protein